MLIIAKLCEGLLLLLLLFVVNIYMPGSIFIGGDGTGVMNVFD